MNANEYQTAKAIRQTSDAFGVRAVVFGATDTHEGLIVHSPGGGRVVVASAGKFYAARRAYHDGMTRLDLAHTSSSLDGAIHMLG